MKKFTFLALCACVANALLLAGCSKRTTWDYETVEGDDETLEVYGRFGWEMVSVSPASDGMSKFIFKKAADAEWADGEAEARTKDNNRITDKEYHDAVAGPGGEPERNPKEDEMRRKEDDEKLERQAGWDTQYLTGTGNDNGQVIANGAIMQSRDTRQTGTGR